MRISDWSSDVCSSDLTARGGRWTRRRRAPVRRCCIVMAVTLDQVRTMRIGLVVDSACDLPKEFIERHDIEILPIAVRIDGTTEVDYRDQAATLRSEEHTSELQSLMRISYAVFGLKKKNNKNHYNMSHKTNTN